MRLYDLIPYTFFFVMTLIMILGLRDLPVDFKVDDGYIIGILTASSILFGFWAVLIERQPKERIEKWLFQEVTGKLFFFSFILLVLSVIVTYFTALSKIPSIVSLLVCTFSFLANAYFITIPLHHHIFKH